MPIRKSSSQNQTFRYENLEPRQVLAGSVTGINPNFVVERAVFYNDSIFDGNDVAANANDDAAIATTKVALLPGQTAAFENYTNYSLGVNGIVVDANLANAAAISADDVVLSSGSGDQASDFTVLNVTPDVDVRVGAGVGGSDRVTITLPNGSVTNEFLQVRILANSDTGFTADDVFYFGNVIAETGNTDANTVVNLADVSLVRENQSGFSFVGVDNQWDINRDGTVNLADIGLVRTNQSGFTATPLITAPTEPDPPEPEFNGTEYFASSAAEVEDALSQVVPGDIVTLRNGTYTNQQILFDSIGTEELPILLRAETPGQVILNGNSTINISGDWLIVDGLNFDGGALDEGDHIVEFRDGNQEATNSRFTNSQIIDYNPSDINTRYFWVSLYGENNRVDHNTFSGQNHSGVTVTVWRNSDDPDNHLIDNNHFVDRPEGNGNGFEAIRIGTSDQSLSDSFTTVESNLFERIDGEIEIISVKSGSNILRNNTFLESAGTLTLRHGDNNLVEGNYFIGNQKDRSGGVRVIGEDQVVVNNYFEGLDGRAGGAISISAGGTSPPLNGHATVRNALIANNTIVDVNGAAFFLSEGLGNNNGQGVRTALAENVTFVNNLVSTTDDPIFDGDQGTGFVFENNIVFGQTLGSVSSNSGFIFTDPQLAVGADGLSRLSANSPAIDAAFTGFASATGGIDIEGQTRGSVFDIGADEFSTAAVTRGPLFPGAVGLGHCFVEDEGDPPTTDGLIVQANQFTSALDPNNDGDTFEVVSTNEAFSGTVVVAPEGSRVNLPGTQDAVLTYDLQFSEAGTYTAYYRARGFNGSSNSFYTPDDFFTAPDVSETISNDGNFVWETGGTYEVAAADLDSVFEFSISKREADAELDVFVFHLDDSLTEAELDALFA